MKKIRAFLLMLIAIISVTILASCGKKATISIVNVTPGRTRIGVTLKISDPDSLITASSVEAIIYNSDDEKVKTISFDELVEDEQTKTFDDLDKETTYKLVVKATVDDKSKTYYNKKVSTTSVGTQDNPIKITTIDEFTNIQYDSDAYYSLEADLDFQDATGAKSKIEPLFDSTTTFDGHFDGNGHTISNFEISTSDVYSGIFGYIGKGASVEDLNIENATLTSTLGRYLYLGTLAGCNQGEIKNVHAKNITISHLGTATTRQYIGGLVGVNCYKISSSSVDNVTMTLRSRLQSTVGGFVGSNGGVVQNALYGIEIDSCYATAVEIKTDFVTTHTVDKDTATDADYIQYTGGFVGESMFTIKNSYAEAKINGSATFTAGSKLNNYIVSLGGFAGRVINASTLEGCVSYSNITYTTADAYTLYVGALVGEVVNSYILNSVGILYGENSVVDTADYSNDSDEDIKKLYAKKFDGIGNIKNILITDTTKVENSGYVMAKDATVKTSDEGSLELASDAITFDTTNLVETVLAFYNKKIGA